MIFKETFLKGAFVIKLDEMQDERGFFARAWCKHEFEENGLNSNLVQCNLSYNYKKNTLRGMHFQHKPYEETKLVRCIRGSIYDVIIDLRQDSLTYKKWFGLRLSAENRKALYVPKGFAHGYLTLEDNSEVFYQATEFYNPECEDAVRWNDPVFGIEWPIREDEIIISEKDSRHKLI